MNCPKCNKINNPGSKFCGGCGTNLTIANNTEVAQQNTPQPEEIEILVTDENVKSSEQIQTQTNEPQIINNQTVEVIDGPVAITPQPDIANINLNVNAPQQPEITSQPSLAQPEILNQNISPIQQPDITNINTNQYQQPEIIPQPTNTVAQPLQSNTSPQQKKASKLPIIIGIILGITLIIVIIVCLSSKTPSVKQTEKNKINDMFNPDKLIKVKSKDKYGYINTKGEFQIQAIYDNASEFIGDYALVQGEVEVDGINRTMYQIIDQKGNTKKQSSNEIKYISSTESWIIDDAVYNSSLKKLSPENVKADYEDEGYYIWVNSKENTGGIMNKEGKITYTYTFKNNEDYISLDIPEIDESLKERYCIVSIENDYEAIVNCDTGVVVYDYAKERIFDSDDNIFEIQEKNSYNLKEIMYIQGDKILYRSSNPEIDLYYYPGYVSIRDGSKSYSERYKYLDTKTGQILDEQPTSDEEDEVENLNEWETFTSNKKFNCSTGYGLMNNETITLPCEWDSLEYLSIDLYKFLKEMKKDYIYGRKDDKWYLINIQKKEAIAEFSTTYITKEIDSTFISYTDSVSKTKKVYNLISNKSINVDSDNYLTVYSNYITVKDTINKTLKYYNTNLELIYTQNL